MKKKNAHESNHKNHQNGNSQVTQRSQRTAKKGSRNLASFWIAPVLVGSCLATGYEVTQRVMISIANNQESKVELFKDLGPFPWIGLEGSEAGDAVKSSIMQIDTFLENAKLSEKEKRLISELAVVQEKEMQTLLDALENSRNGSNIPNQKKPKKTFSGSKQPIFGQEIFNELLRTLPKP